LLSLSVTIYASEIRDWQTVDGKEYKGALLLLTDDGNVQIYDDNSHNTVVLPFKSLCEEDQEYLKGHSNPFQIDGETQWQTIVSTKLHYTLIFTDAEEGKYIRLQAAWVTPRIQNGPWSEEVRELIN
jgi:hypothetical protein